MVSSELLNTGQKAQRINQDARRYGTFAEIGAGQEVARWFFRAGGAAGTVAKAISAYDMAVSDALDGPTDEYARRKPLAAKRDRQSGRRVRPLRAPGGGPAALLGFPR